MAIRSKSHSHLFKIANLKYICEYYNCIEVQMNSLDCDFQACLSSQPRRLRPPSSKVARELATELLELVNEDTNRALAIVMEIMYYNPDRSVEWYYEQAVSQLRLIHYRSA